MGKATKLSNKRERFCQEYMIDLNATQAAKRAGYSEDTAKSQGQRLLTNVDVQSRIQELLKEKSEDIKVTIQDVLNGFMAEATNQLNKGAERVQAWIQIGKHIGFYEVDNAQKNPYKPEPPAPKAPLPDEWK